MQVAMFLIAFILFIKLLKTHRNTFFASAKESKGH